MLIKRYVIVGGDKSYVDDTGLNTLAAQVQVNSYLTQLWTTVAQHPHKPHLSNVYRCCPLPNLHQTNKLYSVQRVKSVTYNNREIWHQRPKASCLLITLLGDRDMCIRTTCPESEPNVKWNIQVKFTTSVV